MKRFLMMLIVVLSGLVIASCNSRHVADTPDTTRPTIIARSPLGNATGVPVNTTITATFSEGMNASTIDDTSFYLMKTGTTTTVIGTISYDSAGNFATFTTTTLDHNTQYTMTVTTAVQDASGNALGAVSSWSFTTIPPPGTLDASFGSNGLVRRALGFSDDTAYAAAIQQDGKIITTGSAALSSGATSTTYFTLARFQANGVLDTTFGQNGRADYFIGASKCMEMQPSDEKIVAAGSTEANASSSSDFVIARYNTDGMLDTGFGSNGTVTMDMGYDRDTVNAMAIQADGKIIAVGEGISQGAGAYDSVIARFNSDGTLDTSFALGGKRIDTNSRLWAVKLQSDGKIVVGGNSTDGSGTPFVYLTRYDSNGSVDSLFSSGTVSASPGTKPTLKGIEIQADGKILVLGTTNATLDYRGIFSTGDLLLIRYNADGTLDNTFGSGGIVIKVDTNHITEAVGGLIGGLAIQADGKIVVTAMCQTTGVITTSDFALFRFNTDGTLDTIFGNDGRVKTDFGSNADDFPSDVFIQQDGKIVVVGSAWNGLNFDIGMARYWP